MTNTDSRVLPFLTSLNGLSYFGDLTSKLNAIKVNEPAKINIIFVSLYEELRRNFVRCVDLHFLRKNVSNTVHVRELHLFKFKKSIDAAIQGQRKIFIFDAVTSIEALAVVIRAAEKGHEIHVFHPWTHPGKEKRSAFSTLLRSCKNNCFSVSQSEMAMWSAYTTQRMRSLEVDQSIEFI